MGTEITKKEKLLISLFKYCPILGVIISILLALLVYSFDIVVGDYTYNSLWAIAGISFVNSGIHIIGLVLVILFVANIVLCLLGLVKIFQKKNGVMIIALSNLMFHLSMLLIRFVMKYTSGLGVFLIVLNLIIATGMVVLVFIYKKKYKDLEEVNDIKEEKIIELTKTKKNLLIIDLISIVGLLSLFIVPLYSYTFEENTYTFWLINGLFGDGTNIGLQLSFLFTLFIFIGILIYFIHTITFYFNYEKHFVKKSNVLVYGTFALSLIYFLIGYFSAFICSYQGFKASTISFIPFIIMTFILLGYSVIKGKYKFVDEEELNNKKIVRFEPLIYLLILTVVSFMLLFVNVIEVHYQLGNQEHNQAFTGLQLLEKHAEIGGGYQVLTFIVLAVILTSVILLVICACSYFAKNKDYYRFTKLSIYLNVLFMFILGISGFYFNIAQKINEENLQQLIEGFGLNINIEFVSEITSQTIILFVASLIVLIVAIFRGQLNIATEPEVKGITEPVKEPIQEVKEPEIVTEKEVKEEEKTVEEKGLDDFDACPVFTELDSKKDAFERFLAKRKQYLFESPNLPDLVTFIVDYARESRLHLSYTREDIATFVAGLGASRLTILQGMSGTGKTSLPKIFSEAILGNCEIVEVESSWRDKNELLGYYNEFSKTYSPKKFTEKLYKAKLNSEIVTFIVLDEMNLSRIEYYFSDFLSLMEHEEHKREIKLLNVKLQRIENNEKHNYLALEEGHTIKIPTNVWFIGTANRDESTFEISDKVYDRAQTMNFNKRAPKVRSYSKPIPQRYLSYQTFSSLLKEAINNGKFEAEDSEVIKEVEKILQPFNISFGNRVLKQIEEFVKIYCACFNNPEEVIDEAVEKILLSKVVAKLEFKNVDNKDKLVKQFNKLNLYACSEFVSKLNED